METSCQKKLQQPSGHGRLSKYEAKKLWKTLFRPKCFGDEPKLLRKCIPEYYKNSSPEKVVYPCEHFQDCLEEAIRRQNIKYGLDDHGRKIE